MASPAQTAVTVKENKPAPLYQDFIALIVDEDFREKAYLFMSMFVQRFDVRGAVAYAENVAPQRAGAFIDRYMGDVYIRQEIKQRTKEIYGDTVLQRAQVIRELSRIAYADINNILDFGAVTEGEDGTKLTTGISLRPGIDAETSPAIKKIRQTTRETYNEKTEVRTTETTIDVQLHDKAPALQMLSKHLALVRNDTPPEKGFIAEMDTDKILSMPLDKQIAYFEDATAQLKKIRDEKERKEKVIVQRKKAFAVEDADVTRDA